jgi:hypothetical protein
LKDLANERENPEPEMSASTIDQKYFELVALADRLSGVSKQLKGKPAFVNSPHF